MEIIGRLVEDSKWGILETHRDYVKVLPVTEGSFLLYHLGLALLLWDWRSVGICANVAPGL